MSLPLARLLCVALLPLLLAGCASGPSASPAGEAQGKSQQKNDGQLTLGDVTYSDRGTKDARGMAELNVQAGNFYFEPTFLRGQPGQSLKLEIQNESGTLHNISLQGQSLDTDIPPNGKAEVELVFPSSGAVRFFCKYHVPRGMNGQLLAGDVEPQPISEGAQPPSMSEYNY